MAINTSFLDTTLIRAVGDFKGGWAVEKKSYNVRDDPNRTLVRLVHIGRIGGHAEWINLIEANVPVSNADHTFDDILWIRRVIEFLRNLDKLDIMGNDVNGAMIELSQLAYTAATQTTVDLQRARHFSVPGYGQYY